MVTILARSRWTSTAAKGTPFTWSRVRGIVCHYPAMGKSVGVLTQAQETSRLRGWRNYHVGALGWGDIGYNYCITQAGRIYSLRGDRIGAHAVGHNSRTVGVLFMVGDNEPLTKAAQASFRALRATLRKRGAGSGLWGHTQMSGNSTRCPGPYIMADIRSGVLKSASAGVTVGGGGASVPVAKPSSNVWDTSPRIKGMSKAEIVEIQKLLVGAGYSVGSYGADGSYKGDTVEAVKKAQKALGLSVDGVAGPATVAALKKAQKATSKPVASKPAPAKSKAPAFPLPRKPGQMCFYGIGSEKTAVTGKMRNTLAPNDVVQGGKLGWYSKGLMAWQKAAGITADGRFGTGTEAKAKALQKKHGQKVDGKIGPDTWKLAWA